MTNVSINAPLEQVGGLQRRVHYRFKDKQSESAFLKLLEKRQNVGEELRVLPRLYAEKTEELNRLADALQKQFAVKPDVDYEYDADKLAINEVVKTASGESRPRLHMVLKDKAAEQTFIQLAAAKRLTSEELSMIQLLVREKRLESDEVDRLLANNYAVVKERRYQYDVETMTLYELLKLPEGAEVPKTAPRSTP